MSDYTFIVGDGHDASSCHLLKFDGGAEPNPGEASAGAVLYDSKRKLIAKKGVYIKHATNNIAEYSGLILGLETAKDLKIKKLLIEGDSMLIVSQIIGKWKVKNEELKIYNDKAKKLLTNFLCVGIKHVYREKNTDADDITKEVIKTKKNLDYYRSKEEEIQSSEISIELKKSIDELKSAYDKVYKKQKVLDKLLAKMQ